MREGRTAAQPATRMAGRKVVIFNVRHSPNLGDGVIADCLERELGKRLANTQIVSVDLAGRTRPAAVAEASRKRAAVLSVLQALPSAVRDLTVAVALGGLLTFRLRPAWRKELSDADFAVFGGGQLIQDGDLNFPLKIAAAAAECDRRGLPTALFAVGAAPSRSAWGRRLFARLLRSERLVHAAARDDHSARNLAAIAGIAPKLCRDPGLLAASIYPVVKPDPSPRPIVGLGVTHPAVLRHHGSNAAGPGDDDALKLYRVAVASLVAQGFIVRGFTNGASEDEAFLADALGPLAGPDVSVEPRPPSPEALARLIGGFDALVAHRLHANIIAFAYGVPHIGLAWDGKLDAFLASVDRPDGATAFDAGSMAEIGASLARVMADGPHPRREQIVAETEQGVAALAASIVEAWRSQTIGAEATGATVALARQVGR